jgi:hypothetical protein
MLKSDMVKLVEEWPQPGTGNAGPRIRTGECALVLAYPLPSEEIAVVTFPACLQLLYGHPNDEVLHCHPLYAKGLKHYSVHRVLHSSRLAALERANSVHHRHDAINFLKDMEHYIFTFQEATLECLVCVGGSSAPRVQVVASWNEATPFLARDAA